MSRSVVRIDENTDVAATLEKLKRECASRGVAMPEVLFAEIDRTVRDLAKRGSELVRVGSNMHVSRTITIEGDRYSVRVVADFVAGKRSMFSWLRSAFRLR